MSETKRKNKCRECNKKVGLNGFECKCDANHVFCDVHKFPFAHKCTISNFETQKHLLLQTLTKCTADKIAERA